MSYRLSSSRNISLLLAGLLLILVNIACGAGSAAPQPSAPAPIMATEEISPGASGDATPAGALPTVDILTLPSGGGGPVPTALPLGTATAESSLNQPQPAINESRRLTLEFPPKIRVGEGDIIRMTLEVDTLGNITPTAEIQGNTVTGQTVELPNLYETHNVTAEARLDMAGMEVKPADLISEPLSPGESATFYWSIRPPEVGKYRGTIWLYLRFANKSTGEENQKTVSAQLVEIDAVNLLGLPLGAVRGVGAVGSFVGGVLGFPFFEDIVKFLFRKRKNL